MINKKEIWKIIPLFPEFSASSNGRIRSDFKFVRYVHKNGKEYRKRKFEKILKPQIQNGGYFIVHLNTKGKRYAKTVHSLVISAFKGLRPKGFDICHNNGKRLDNRPTNLRYDTRKNNFADKRLHGTFYAGATQSKLKISDIRKIRFLEGKIKTAQIAKTFGIGQWHVIRIWRRECWKYIK